MKTLSAEFNNVDKTTAGLFLFLLIHQSVASRHLVVEGVNSSPYKNIFSP